MRRLVDMSTTATRLPFNCFRLTTLVTEMAAFFAIARPGSRTMVRVFAQGSGNCFADCADDARRAASGVSNQIVAFQSATEVDAIDMTFELTLERLHGSAQFIGYVHRRFRRNLSCHTVVMHLIHEHDTSLTHGTHAAKQCFDLNAKLRVEPSRFLHRQAQPNAEAPVWGRFHLKQKIVDDRQLAA